MRAQCLAGLPGRLAWQWACPASAVQRLPLGARALFSRDSYAALGAMVPHRPRMAAIFIGAGAAAERHSKVLALAARRGTSRVAGLLRVLSRPQAETHPRFVGAGPLPVTAAAGGVPARGIPSLDATAGAYVTSIGTFYVQY